jgi:hypothetical protein
MRNDHLYRDSKYSWDAYIPVMTPREKACRRDLPKCSYKWPSWLVNQQKGEPISQKDNRRDTSLSQPHRQPLFFDA